MLSTEKNDWYEGSTCGCCGKEECWGECDGYDDWELETAVEEDRTGDYAPIVDCTGKVWTRERKTDE